MDDAIDLLLVEDSVEDAELAVRELTRYHMLNRIHVVRDGEEALELIFGEGNYSERTAGVGLGLILLDLQMPKVDGMEVLRRVNADGRTNHIPIVVLTNSTRAPDIAEARRLGAKGYMVKPVDFLKLVETARELGFQWSLFDAPTITLT